MTYDPILTAQTELARVFSSRACDGCHRRDDPAVDIVGQCTELTKT